MTETLKDIVIKHKQIEENYSRQFWNTFGVRLQDFMNLYTGFDIIKFDDDVIKTSDNMSMQERVLEKYGRGAVDLLLRLIE